MRPRLLALILSACASTAWPGPPAYAGPEAKPTPSAQAEVLSLRQQVSEASAEEAAVLDQLDAATGHRRDLDARLTALDRELSDVQGRAQAAEGHLAAVQADVVRAQMDLGTARAGLGRARQEVREQAVSAYLGNPSASAANSVLRSGNVRELASTTSYLESVAEARKRVVDHYRELRHAAEGRQGEAEAKKEQAKAQRDLVVGRQAELEAVRSQVDATRRQGLEQEAQHQALLAGARARVGEFEGRISALRSESDSVSGLLQTARVGAGVGEAGGRLQGGQAGRHPVAAGARLSHPIPGAPFTSMFGPRLHPVFGTVRMHNGVDIRGATGTPIRAAAAGTVVYAGPRGGYGNTVVIDHDGSLATLYAHQSTVYVATGKAVAQGQVIGAVGSTGFSTGPHLHFEVRVNGAPVSPLGYLW